jgi:hypothetical protein
MVYNIDEILKREEETDVAPDFNPPSLVDICIKKIALCMDSRELCSFIHGYVSYLHVSRTDTHL